MGGHSRGDARVRLSASRRDMNVQPTLLRQSLKSQADASTLFAAPCGHMKRIVGGLLPFGLSVLQPVFTPSVLLVP